MAITLNPILLSLKVALIATVFSSIIGTWLAFKLSKKSFKISELLETIILLPMVLPPSVTGYLLLIAIGKRSFIGRFLDTALDTQIVFTWVAAVLAAVLVSLPLMFQNAKGAFLSLDPVYENAAKTLGAGKTRIFWTITLPLAKEGIFSGIILTFARSLGEFGATLMVAGNIPGRTQTIPTAIYYAVESGNTETANKLVLFMVVLSFLLILVMNKYIKRKV